MPDRDHDELESELRDLGSRIDYPPAPDVSRAVSRRLGARATEHPRARRLLPMLARPGWSAAAAATVLLSLSVLSPAVRATISDLVLSGASDEAGGAAGGAGGAGAAREAEYGPQLPPSPTDTRRPDEDGAQAGAGSGASTLPPPGTALGLGARIQASEAETTLGGLLLPEAPELRGEPHAIYAIGPEARDGVAVVFGPGPALPPLGNTDAGLILVEVPGDAASVYPATAGSYGTAQGVDVGGSRGFWIPDGRSLRPQPGDAEELAGGAVVWERGGTTLLMRAGVTKEEALRIAGTVR